MLCRYVNDLFLLFPNRDPLNRFFTTINSIHRNIVLTKEHETNNCLHFLDVLIEKTSTGFITSISNNIRQELSNFIRHKAVVNGKLRCFQNTRKLRSWFSIKDRQALLNRFNVVYKLTCSCGTSFIGQTQRNLINRIEEHRTLLSSSVCRHLQANPDHWVDFHSPEVNGSDNWRRLQIPEYLLIQEHKPELNATIPSMLLCIFNL